MLNIGAIFGGYCVLAGKTVLLIRCRSGATGLVNFPTVDKNGYLRYPGRGHGRVLQKICTATPR